VCLSPVLVVACRWAKPGVVVSGGLYGAPYQFARASFFTTEQIFKLVRESLPRNHAERLLSHHNRPQEMGECTIMSSHSPVKHPCFFTT
jgi:hypothetical protein